MEVTNHTAGPRGVNLKEGGTRWVEPGETVTFKKDEILGALPDFGKKRDAGEDGADHAAALAAETKRADAAEAAAEKVQADHDKLLKANAELTKQVEDLTKPAK